MANRAKKKPTGTKRSARPKVCSEIIEISPQTEQEFCPAVEISKLQQEITNRVTGRALELVDDTIQHIKEGNFQAMKYLFEAVGLFPIKSADAQSCNNELGKKLADVLERSADPEPEPAVSAHAVP
ncbi:MAG: hypothetical protein JOZ80_01510 [Acidobacteriaceae bacterium]|nr:hypothetical protein [Acidobacteriaceae bacterium]